MDSPISLYRRSLALLTDLYELTMAQGHWKAGTDRLETSFYMSYRLNPFGGGFSISCGLSYVVDLLGNFHFTDEDVSYLATLRGNDGKAIFETAFLDYLRKMKLTCDVDAVPEGTVVFPQAPMVRVTGPIIQCQVLETPILNMINFQSLIATKAARICIAAKGDPVLEFGLRRAQGVDGALAASRAAYIGGCVGTSNVLAGQLFGIPVKGTHAHSWVMCFESEVEAFEKYAEAMPNNCVFLVDTYNSLEGVRRAADVGKRLRQRGFELAGIRLDSGDLAYLSIEARRILNEAGFQNAKIVASNDLDEHIIASLKEQGAAIDIWGVGTKLATAYDQPAMGGVYKLAAVREPSGAWRHKVKLSEQSIKISNPGLLQTRRYFNAQGYVADAIYDEATGIGDGCTIVDPMDLTRRKNIPRGTGHEDLLVPVMRRGKVVHALPPLDTIRDRARAELSKFHVGIKRFVNPHQYPVGLELRLWELKKELVLHARGL